MLGKLALAGPVARFVCVTLFSALLLTFSKTTPALAITFTGSFGVTAHNSDPGLVVNTSPFGGGSLNFDLDFVGDNTGWFDLFKIWTKETDVAIGEDTVPYPISVDYLFTTPPAGGTQSGDTQGVVQQIIGWFLWAEYGQVQWSGPLAIPFGDGGILTAYLTNETFNFGLYDTTPGAKKGAIVKAKFELTAVPQVPLPAALPLLASALIGLVMLRRFRRHTRAI